MRLNQRPLTGPGGNQIAVHPFPGTVRGQAIVAMCVPLLIMSGCGGHGNRPPLGTVHGTVTLDGKPLPRAIVAFQPIDPARTSTGITDDDGKYELIYIRQDKGAKVGAHRVRISAAKADKSPLLPPRYNIESVLKAEVRPGDNTLDFSLSLNRHKP